MNVDLGDIVVLESATTTLRIDVLQGFEATDGGRSIHLPLVSQRLLALLALSDRPQTRVHAAGVLWPEADERHASANLRSALWRLSSIEPPLVVRDPSLRLALGITVDVRTAYALAARVLEPAVPLPDLGPDPTAWFVDDLLPDWNEDWVLIERERFRQARLHALEALCDRFSEVGRMMPAIQAGLAAVTADPFRESAHRALIRAHLREGNRSEALRQYASYRRMLDEELGIEPTAALSEMFDISMR